MSIPVLHFDVFTTEPGKGNPAGIVLAADGMSDSAMQALAARTGFPDTAFVSSAGFRAMDPPDFL
jgi:PhzF family phenazine biosynthesis protein